ncbi:MAG: T9SS type A sorting domain-containing protein [Flavobacteriaceae bacterium]|nr:T9SS type A sorting domain-containing protein [Flavobacteriaceae bacterium]
MKKLLLLLVLSFTVSIFSQVTNEGTPASWNLTQKAGLNAIALPGIDIKKIKAEDDVNDKLEAKPYRVGVMQKVNYGLDNAGVWTKLPNGDRIWRILFSSKDAIHLSVNFNRFYLPKGANIYLYNDDRSDLLGAYEDNSNNEKQMLGSWFVNGERLWIEYYEPKDVQGEGILNISSVIHGYRMAHTYQKGYDSLEKINESGDCNHDVDCPIGADFEAERDILKKSVALLSMNNGYICSGALVNNTAEDKTPYFLTANHCYTDPNDIDSNPALYSMRFNWISPNPVCAATTSSTTSSSNITSGGSTLIAKNPDSDFMLVKLNNAIPTGWDVTFAGWDRTDIEPTFEVGIHHPSGDIMKICRDDTGAVKATTGSEDVWLIGGTGAGIGDGWELGVTEGGSSGSPLFDQNGRIIGQLFGGTAACTGTNDNDAYDLYGRFATSWDSGVISSLRLNNWLDPLGTNPPTIDALDNILAVNDEYLEKNISIFPNPTSGFVQIKIREWVSDMRYEVYNVIGQTLKSNELQNNEILDLTDLPSDIYFIKITELETNRILVKKLVLKR